MALAYEVLKNVKDAIETPDTLSMMYRLLVLTFGSADPIARIFLATLIVCLLLGTSEWLWSRIWPNEKAAQPIELIKLAQWATDRHGWRFEPNSVDGLALLDGLRHAVHGGKLVLEGQKDKVFAGEYDHLMELFHRIPPESLEEAEITWPQPDPLNCSNDEIELKGFDDRVTHRNLRITDEEAAMRWLVEEGIERRAKLNEADEAARRLTHERLKQEQREIGRADN